MNSDFSIRLTSAFSTFAVTEVKPKQQRPQARVRSWGSILVSANCPGKRKDQETNVLQNSRRPDCKRRKQSRCSVTLLKRGRKLFLASAWTLERTGQPLCTKRVLYSQSWAENTEQNPKSIGQLWQMLSWCWLKLHSLGFLSSGGVVYSVWTWSREKERKGERWIFLWVLLQMCRRHFFSRLTRFINVWINDT